MLKKAWDGKYKEFPRNMLKYKGKFENVLCFNEKEYDKKKEEAKKERYMSKDDKGTEKKTIDKLDQLILDKRKEGLSMDKIAVAVNRSKTTIKRTLDKHADEMLLVTS